MRKVRLWLGALLSVGVILVVLKQDDSAPIRSSPTASAPQVAVLKNAKTLNWTNAAARFREAAVVDTREIFDNSTKQKTVVEIVKTRSKYPYIRVETPFTFDPQAQAWIPQPPVEYVADQVLLQLKAGTTEEQFSAALERVKGRVVQKHAAGDSTLILIGLPKPTIEAVPEAIISLIKYSGLFEIVEPHFIRRASAMPNDPEFYWQWALQNIQAPAAWDIQRGHSSVVVAVADSGIDYWHEDLWTRVWANPGEVPGNFIDDDHNGHVDDHRGVNFAYEDTDPYDDFGHGTFVSGLIGAAGDNGIGITGICWDVRIMPIKIMDDFGLLYSIDEIRGFDYARTEGAKIVNASLGGYQFSQSEYNAIVRLRTAGVLLVAAAGNDAYNNDVRLNYPSSYNLDNIIAVAYTDSADRLSINANYGANTVDLAAPGVSVYSTLPVGELYLYDYDSGSSYAAPHVAGVAALLKAQTPNLSYAQIKSKILATTDPRSWLQGRMVSGGRLNAYEALIPRVPLADALESGSLVWQTGGTRTWFGQRLASSDGVDAARCGNITDGQSSWLQTTVTGPGRLWFVWRTSSEPDADYLQFSLDGTLRLAISGDYPWEELAFDLPAGTHTVRWTYAKDGSDSFGEDKAWLDDVLYMRDSGGPTITVTNPVGTNLYATDVQFEGTAWDLYGVASVECRVGTGPWQTVSTVDDFANWQVQLSNLALGTNRIQFRGVDTMNQTSVVSRTYMVLSPLTVNVAGCGAVDAKYTGLTWQQAGKTLTVRATPCAGHLFTHWSGDINSSNATLKFVMQPNLTFQANFVVNQFLPVVGSYYGLFHEAAGALHESSGLFKMTLTDTGAFSGTIVLDGATNAFKSRFDPVSGLSAFTISRSGKSALQASLQLGFNDQLSGQLGNGIWTADLIADRGTFSTTNPPPFAGMYTLVFPGDQDFTASPGGHGFATATVGANGRVSIDGRLGDGTRVLQNISVSKNGDWPFYAPLYSAPKGSTLGWLKFLSPPGFTNQLTSWIRPSMPTARYYRNGFSNELSVLGSPYQVRPATNAVIDCTNALLTLSGADFVTPLTNNMILTSSNKVLNSGPYNVSMKIVRTNGTFSGSLILGRRTNTFQGVFLQPQNIGLGYFLGSNHVGEVRFEPAP